MRTVLFAASLVTLTLLSGCFQESSGPPIVEIGAEAGTVRTVQVSLSAEVKTAKQGLVSRSPTGLKASYRVVGSKADTRVDLPGTMFLDGKARVAFYNAATNKTSILLSSTMKADPILSRINLNLANLNVNTGLANSLALNEVPFMKMTSNRWTTLAKAKGAKVDPVAASELPAQTIAVDAAALAATPIKATRTLTYTGATLTQVLYFDSSIGAVTRVDTTINNSKQIETSSSRLLYTIVPGVTGGIVPYDITTTYDVSLKQLQPAMKLPTSNRTLTRDAPVLGPGKRVTQSFVVMSGQGTVDMNKQTTTQHVKYTSIAVNTLPDSYFQIGQ